MSCYVMSGVCQVLPKVTVEMDEEMVDIIKELQIKQHDSYLVKAKAMDLYITQCICLGQQGSWAV